MEAALSDVIQFEEALGNITDKPMDSNHLVSVKVDIFEESPYFFKYLHCLNTYEQGCSRTLPGNMNGRSSFCKGLRTRAHFMCNGFFSIR